MPDEADALVPVKRETGASPVRTRHCKLLACNRMPLSDWEGVMRVEKQVRRPAWVRYGIFRTEYGTRFICPVHATSNW